MNKQKDILAEVAEQLAKAKGIAEIFSYANTNPKLDEIVFHLNTYIKSAMTGLEQIADNEGNE